MSVKGHRMNETTKSGIVGGELARRAFIADRFTPAAEQAFSKWPWLQSAALFVAQYWNDEAADAVQLHMISSQLETPDLTSAFVVEESENWDEHDPINLPEEGEDSWGMWRELYLTWDANGSAISMFAAYCAEGGDQCAGLREVYRPYAIVRRDSSCETGLRIEVIGTQLRPWLDGVAPMRDEDD